MMRYVAWFAGLLTIAEVASAVTLRVPEDFASITAAADHAVAGDTIEVGPGRWSPSRTGEVFPLALDRAVTLRGTPGRTTVDAEFRSRLFEVTDGPVRIEDLELVRGSEEEAGGAISVRAGHLHLARVRIADSSTEEVGTALAVRGGTVVLENCLLVENPSPGGTLHARDAAVQLAYCTVAHNGGPALVLDGRSQARLSHTVVAMPGTPAGRTSGIVVGAQAAFEMADNRFDGCFEGVLVAAPGAELSTAALQEARRAEGLRVGPVDFADAELGDYRLAAAGGAAFLGAFGGDAPLAAPAIGTSRRARGAGDPGILGPSVPNPGSSTTVHFTVSNPGVIDLGIYNVLGQRVRSLLSRHMEAGEHAQLWDGRDDAGEELPPGIYFLRVTEGERVDSRRIVLVR